MRETGGKGTPSGRKTGGPAGRNERLAAALRENLRRRKAQLRARGPSPGGEKPDVSPKDPESR